MSLKITISIDGEGESVSGLLEAQATRFEGSRAELLGILGELAASSLQENIRTEGGRLGVSWPALHPATIRIREYYRHGRGPRLVRGGDLLHSLRVLAVNAPDSVDVGSVLPYASVLDEGGAYKGRQVQAFPYLDLSEQDLDDLLEVALDFLDGKEVAA